MTMIINDPTTSRQSQPQKFAPKGTPEQLVPVSDAIRQEETIRNRAHELFVNRGGGPGSEQQDWLQAERETRSIRNSEHNV